MMEFVIDTSAAIELLNGLTPDPQLRRMVFTQRGYTPELFDIEAVSTVRRLVLTSQLDAAQGAAVLDDVHALALTRTAHKPLLSRVWDLRHSITPYDATYIALAEHLGAPLLTCDARLGRAHGHEAEVIVYPMN